MQATSHPSAGVLRLYQDRALPPDQLLEVGDHIAECPACRSQLAGGQDLGQALEALGPEAKAEHLGFEQIAAHVDGTLSGEAIGEVRRHLSTCPRCRADADDLRAARAELADPVPPPPPAPAPEVVLERGPLPWFVWLPVPIAVLAIASAIFFSSQAGTLRERLDEAEQQAGVQQELQQKATDLESRGQELEQENQRLQARLPELQKEADALKKERTALEDRLKQARAGATSGAIKDGASTVILDSSGKAVRVTGTEPLPPLASAALERGQLTLPDGMGELFSTASAAKAGARFSLKTPIGTRVAEATPRFEWEAVPKATRYEVVLKELTEAASPVEYDAGKDTAWTPPEPLLRGSRYSWQVRAYQGDELIGTAPQSPDADGRFQVVSAEVAAQLEKDLAAADGSQLHRAAVYASAGLLAEAERELSTLSHANPSSGLVQRLLESLRAARKPR
jgi:hypothetical protein